MRIKREDCWKHRGSDMRCATCMWYVPKDKLENGQKDKNTLIGRCRKNAPTMEGYPVVFPGDWCGQHKLDENKI